MALMREPWIRGLLALGAGAAALIAVLIANRPADAPQIDATRLETAWLPRSDLPVPAEPVPKPRFTRTMFTYVELARVDRALDACGGPVAVDIGRQHSVLIAEHDYCGGSDWVPKLRNDDAVRLNGEGVRAGTYVVTEIRFEPRRNSTVGDLPQTDAVLQTCISKTEMILVGLERLDAVTVTS